MTFPSSCKHPTAALALVMSVGFAGACDRTAEPRVSPRSDVQVSLPKRPDLSGGGVETHHADGMLTVAGVVIQRASLLGEDVTVRGEVVEVFTCPEAPEREPEGDDEEAADGAPQGEVEAPFCPKPPHLYLGGEDGERLLFVGSERTPVGEATVGETLTLTGRLELVSPDGRFIRQRGLVVLPEPEAPESGRDMQDTKGG